MKTRNKCTQQTLAHPSSKIDNISKFSKTLKFSLWFANRPSYKCGVNTIKKNLKKNFKKVLNDSDTK